jgi:hypothetical protein
MRRRPSLLPAVAALAITLSTSGAASAFERQWHAGAGFGYALFGNAAGAQQGFGGAAHLTYGLTDTWNLLAHVDLTRHPSGQLTVAGGAVGAAYVLDVLRWVPYAGAMIGGYDLWTGGAACAPATGVRCHSPRVDLSVPVGLDYQLGRSFAVGVEGRYHLLLGGDPAAHLLTVFARAEYVWGF